MRGKNLSCPGYVARAEQRKKKKKTNNKQNKQENSNRNETQRVLCAMSYITGVYCALGHLQDQYAIFALALTIDVIVDYSIADIW